MCGCMNQTEFRAAFTADLIGCFSNYKACVEYMRSSSLFASDSLELRAAVETYLASMPSFSTQNMALNTIHAVHKLHPIDFHSSQPTVQWLVDACLRQHHFATKFPMEHLHFQQSYQHYVEFLFLCSKNKGSVTVPNKMADFMWHSHMQDNQAYLHDTQKMLGFVLNHTDDYPDQKQSNYGQLTDELRAKYFARTHESKKSSSEVKRNYYAGGHQFIDYGPVIYWAQPVQIETNPFNCEEKDACSASSSHFSSFAFSVPSVSVSACSQPSIASKHSLNSPNDEDCGVVSIDVEGVMIEGPVNDDRVEGDIWGGALECEIGGAEHANEANQGDTGGMGDGGAGSGGDAGCGGGGCGGGGCGGGGCGGGGCGG